MALKTFAPAGATVSATAGTTSARLTLDQFSSVVRMRQAGTAECYIKFGDSTVVATTADMPVASGSTELFTKGSTTHVAFITSSGTALISFTNGEGL